MNERFLNLYNQLDHCLKYLVGNPYIKNYISYYEVTLPPESRSLLEEIRLFKNAHKSHGVSNHDEPIAPESWNRFLEAHIAHVKKNPAIVKQNVERAIREAAEEKRRKRGFKGGKNSNSNSRSFRADSSRNSYGQRPNANRAGSNYRPRSPYPNEQKPPLQKKYSPYPLPSKAWSLCFADRLLSEFTFSTRYLRTRQNVNLARWQESLMDVIQDIIWDLHSYVSFEKENVRFTNGVFKYGPQCFQVPNKETPLPYGTKVYAVSVIDSYDHNTKYVFLFNNIGETYGSVIMLAGKPDQYRSNGWTDFRTHGLYYYELCDFGSPTVELVLDGNKVILNAD